MANKNVNSRIQVKRDKSENWLKAESTFQPLEGEIIFYTDLNKIKIGKKDADGNLMYLKDLPFVRVDREDIDDPIEAMTDAEIIAVVDEVFSEEE